VATLSYTRGQSCLEELEAVLNFIIFLRSQLVKFSHLLANVVTNAQLSVVRNNFVIFLVFQFLLANWVVAHHLTARLLVFLNFN